MRRAVATAVILLAGCAPAPPLQHGAGEDGWGPTLANGDEPRVKPVAPRALPIPEGKRVRWERADELAELTVSPGRWPSEHLDGLFDRSVMTSAAAPVYGALTQGMKLRPGTLIVQRHHPRGTEKIVAYFVMEKLADGQSRDTLDWRFLVLDDELRVAAKENLALCARCHADAPFHGLFGVTQDEWVDAE